MKLFTSGCDFIETEPIESIIDTPLGQVTTYITYRGNILDDGMAESTLLLESGARITTFYTQDFEAELLTCRPDHIKIPDQQVLDCWSFLWRFKALKIIHEPIFIATWKVNYLWKESGYNGGEHLEAWTFSDNEYLVSIGTQDDEILEARAIENDYIPKKFIEMINNPYTIVSGFNEGIEVPMPDLEPNDICQIQFNIAWNTEFKDEVATWYAVHCFPYDVLENARVK